MSRQVNLSKRRIVPFSTLTPGDPTTVTTPIVHNLTTGQLVTITDTVGSISEIINNNEYPVAVVDETTFTVPQNTIGYTYSGGGTISASIRPNAGQLNYTRIYLGAIAYMHQFEVLLTEEQVVDPIVGTAQFELQGLVIWTQKAGRIKG